jgi:retinol dehydrogenase-12
MLSYFTGIFVLIGVAVFYFRKHFKGAQFTDNVKAKEKVAIVTGGNSGIGKQIVRDLNLRGAKVYMLCRSTERASEAVKDLFSIYGCDITRMIVLQCDLSDFSSVRRCVEEFNKAEKTLDILINCAGVFSHPKFEKTADGFEYVWQSNYLGHFLLTELLLPKLEESQDGRIINVSGLLNMKADSVDIDTVNNISKNGFLKALSRSKLAQIMHAKELTRRLREDNPATRVTVNACHPGVVNTNILKTTILGKSPIREILSPFSWFFMKDARDGAQTPLYLALARQMETVSGKFFVELKESKKYHKLVESDEECKKLYNQSLKACGVEK